ncbi:hypothetical protein Z945_2182 [Sulfitobacter noctilucae]|nr:hypothetical protein Z945_2182 [Sulfitobacter noctilucae]
MMPRFGVKGASVDSFAAGGRPFDGHAGRPIGPETAREPLTPDRVSP